MNIKELERLYRTARWYKLRAKILAHSKCCAVCGITERLQIDHRIVAVKHNDFFDASNLWVLCISCHSRKTAIDSNRVKPRKTELDGTPSQYNTKHPWYDE